MPIVHRIVGENQQGVWIPELVVISSGDRHWVCRGRRNKHCSRSPVRSAAGWRSLGDVS